MGEFEGFGALVYVFCNSVENDRIWDNEDLMTRLVAQLPVISRINLSQTCSKITKKKCGLVTSMLNTKAKRPNHNRIRVLN